MLSLRKKWHDQIRDHVHLLLRTGTVPASIMRRLLTGYALRFNRRHRRYGHLFKNRSKSVLCISTSPLPKRVNIETTLSHFLKAFEFKPPTPQAALAPFCGIQYGRA